MTISRYSKPTQYEILFKEWRNIKDQIESTITIINDEMNNQQITKEERRKIIHEQNDKLIPEIKKAEEITKTATEKLNKKRTFFGYHKHQIKAYSLYGLTLISSGFGIFSAYNEASNDNNENKELKTAVLIVKLTTGIFTIAGFFFSTKWAKSEKKLRIYQQIISEASILQQAQTISDLINQNIPNKAQNYKTQYSPLKIESSKTLEHPQEKEVSLQEIIVVIDDKPLPAPLPVSKQPTAIDRISNIFTSLFSQLYDLFSEPNLPQ